LVKGLVIDELLPHACTMNPLHQTNKQTECHHNTFTSHLLTHHLTLHIQTKYKLNTYVWA